MALMKLAKKEDSDKPFIGLDGEPSQIELMDDVKATLALDPAVPPTRDVSTAEGIAAHFASLFIPKDRAKVARVIENLCIQGDFGYEEYAEMMKKIAQEREAVEEKKTNRPIGEGESSGSTQTP